MKKDKKLLALAMFLLMATGCATYHTNIVKNISDSSMLIEDVKDNQKRVVMVEDTEYQKTMLDLLHTGDTLVVKSPFYKDVVLKPDVRTVIYFDEDSISQRAQRRQIELQKQAFCSGKTR